ncbi:Kelch-type beta propeller [Phytophthora cactorum]|nr:Kelch-type beta propeller [Phytophthora cactorum]
MASSTKKEDRAKEAATSSSTAGSRLEVRSWEKLHPHGDVYSPRTGHTVTSKDGRVYVFGGTDRRRRQQDLYQLEIETGTWSQVQTRGVPLDIIDHVVFKRDLEGRLRGKCKLCDQAGAAFTEFKRWSLVHRTNRIRHEQTTLAACAGTLHSTTRW